MLVLQMDELTVFSWYYCCIKRRKDADVVDWSLFVSSRPTVRVPCGWDLAVCILLL